MNATPPQDSITAADTAPDTLPPAQSALAKRLRREMHWAIGSLLAGLLVLPAAIYAVGVSLLGPYDATSGGAAHIGSFYGDVFRGLGAPTLSAWSIVLGPMVVVMLLRLILLPLPGNTPPKEALPAAQPATDASAEPVRREPFVGG
jgi:hypothetical protein